FFSALPAPVYNAPLCNPGPALRALLPTQQSLCQAHSGATNMDWLISTAAAQGAAPAQPDFLTTFGPLILIFVVFYFLLIRPQTKRAKEHRNMVAALEAGAEVVTNGGLLGKVTAVSDQYLTVELAEGVTVKVQRHAVTQVLPKGTLKSI